jgi:uncharacterized protein (DUF4415 family)
MNRTPNPEMIDDDNPEWSDKMFEKATTVEDSSLPESFKAAVRRGRPPQSHKKVMLTVRYSTEVIEYFKSTGKGWQTRMDEVLREYVDSHR